MMDPYGSFRVLPTGPICVLTEAEQLFDLPWFQLQTSFSPLWWGVLRVLYGFASGRKFPECVGQTVITQTM